MNTPYAAVPQAFDAITCRPRLFRVSIRHCHVLSEAVLDNPRMLQNLLELKPLSGSMTSNLGIGSMISLIG